MQNQFVLLLFSLTFLSMPNFGASVIFTATPIGAGEFVYDFTINNVGGAVPIAGLLIHAGNSAFGLSAASDITAPPGWDSLAPIPPFDSVESFISLSPASNVGTNNSLSGFTFTSSEDPAALTPADLSVVLVGSDSSQTFTPARPTPEPSGFATGFAALMFAWKLWNSAQWRSPHCGASHQTAKPPL